MAYKVASEKQFVEKRIPSISIYKSESVTIMMNIFEYPSENADKKLESIIVRDIGFSQSDIETVQTIIDAVGKKKDDAVIEYTRRFDSPNADVDSLRVSPEEIDAAVKSVDADFMNALKKAVRQIESFHRRQLKNSWITMHRPGVMMGQLINPVDSAGIYVPGGKGGKTPLVSSVLMGAIPARIANVERIVMTTPPTEKGDVNPHLLAAANEVGVDEIYKVGSAWAIAALAYGTQTIPRVDIIVGPGNIYVTLAKKIVSGAVGTDIIAGPSEILIIADDTAVPEYVAADLLSQAEHDPLASSILVTPSRKQADNVVKALSDQLEPLPRKDIARQSLKDYGAVFISRDIDAAIEIANKIAPEHLELQFADPFASLSKIRNAGAIFIGNYTPEPVGDYIAGPNHVLPTAGAARYASALSVDHFTKKSSMIYYSKEAFDTDAQDIVVLAEIEGLDAHANSVKVRLKH